MSEAAESGFGALSSGTQLLEYQIERVLGHGGFGITYLATDANLHTRFAIKEFMPAEFATRGDGNGVVLKAPEMAEAFAWAKEKFLKEARVLAQFAHPHIVRISRFFDAHDTVYFVMDYIQGETLADIIKREAPVSESRVRAMLLPVISGLAEVHGAGILHRDIKPGNIIIRSDGAPVLIDFGAAKQTLGAVTKSLFSLVSAGTAPIEQYSDDMPQGAWTDIYALGSVSYRMLTGVRPPDAVSRIRHDPLVPAVVAGAGRAEEALLRAVDWSLAVYPQDRPQNLASWVEALEGRLDPPPPADVHSPHPRPAQTAPDTQFESATRTEIQEPTTLTATSVQVAAPATARPAPARWQLTPAAAVIAGLVVALILLGLWVTVRPVPMTAVAARVASPSQNSAAVTESPPVAKGPVWNALAEGEALLEAGDEGAFQALIDRRFLADPADAVATVLQGHRAFAQEDWETGAKLYGRAADKLPELATGPIFARNLVNGLGWATAAVRPLIRAYPTPVMLFELARRSGESGQHGRNRAYELLQEFNRPDLIDLKNYGLLELRERKSCEAKRDMVILLGEAGDATMIPALEEQVDGLFKNRCMKSEVREAVRRLRGRQR